jgi:transcriptional/translational regulatory protein YebC/TACO1
LIDAGLESLETEDGVVTVMGDYTAFASLSQAVESLGINATKSGLERVPNQPVELTEEQMQDVEKILDSIEEDDDVQAVFTNIA